MGATWYDYYVAYGQHRDSSCLDQSNFRSYVKALGGESDTVVIARANHWAVGWCETLLIHETDEKALRAAEELTDALKEYPVLDDEDYSRLEYETACEYWESLSIRDRIDYCKRYRCSIFAARRDEIPDDPCGELISVLAE
jgi:hypothetical protein